MTIRRVRLMQSEFALPVIRRLVVSATVTGKVAVYVEDWRDGSRRQLLEMEPREADYLAAHLTATVTEIVAGRKAA